MAMVCKHINTARLMYLIIYIKVRHQSGHIPMGCRLMILTGYVHKHISLIVITYIINHIDKYGENILIGIKRYSE